MPNLAAVAPIPAASVERPTSEKPGCRPRKRSGEPTLEITMATASFWTSFQHYTNETSSSAALGMRPHEIPLNLPLSWPRSELLDQLRHFIQSAVELIQILFQWTRVARAGWRLLGSEETL